MLDRGVERLSIVLHRLERTLRRRQKLHPHFRPPPVEVAELDAVHERLDQGQADAQRGVLRGADPRPDTDALVAHDNLECLG